MKNVDDLKSWDDWAVDNYRVRRGQKASAWDREGVPLFLGSQVVYREELPGHPMDEVMDPIGVNGHGVPA